MDFLIIIQMINLVMTLQKKINNNTEVLVETEMGGWLHSAELYNMHSITCYEYLTCIGVY
jgi:hypothetical protein